MELHGGRIEFANRSGGGAQFSIYIPIEPWIKITDEKIKEEMIKKANGRLTVPQIFINDFHVGGCDDLYALEAEGKLDELLK